MEIYFLKILSIFHAFKNTIFWIMNFVRKGPWSESTRYLHNEAWRKSWSEVARGPPGHNYDSTPIEVGLSS